MLRVWMIGDNLNSGQIKSIFFDCHAKDNKMPSWDAYKEVAKSRGSLAFELYVVTSVPAKSPDDLKANLPEHLAYQGAR